jgi:acetolactate synthase-1/2/3 large subunit
VKRTAAPLVVDALEDEGIPFTFGIPGTHNIELYDALATSDAIRPILVTDEQSASFMADGLWRATGKLGCVNLVPGAGLTHALSGIAEAWMDNVPMLVLGCGIRRDTGRAYQLHDIDQQALARPVVKATYLVEDTADAYRVVREACQRARGGVPGPVFVEVPADLYLVSREVPKDYRVPSQISEGGEDPDKAIEEGISTAAALLQASTRPLLYLGAGSAGAGELLVELSERLEAPVATTIQGKGVFPESHPLWLWPGFGDPAPSFVREIVSACDATLAIGCRFSEVGTGSYGSEPPGRLIHVDLDPEVPGKNFEADVAVEADARTFVEGLLGTLGDPRSPRQPDPELRVRIRSGHDEIQEGWDGGGEEGKVSPYRLLTALQDRVGPDAVYTTDSGNGTFLAMEMLRLDRPRKFLAPVDFSCMGYSVPAAIGAKLGDPGLPVVALAGDGAFLMTGLEALTAAREELGIVILVLRDTELAQIAQFQGTALGRKVASQVPDFELKHLAAGLGIDFFVMRTNKDIERILGRAATVVEAGRPVLVDVNIDYSKKTYFTRGVVKTNLLRLPMRDQARFIGRALWRRLRG